jgi:hypothetical protein
LTVQHRTVVRPYITRQQDAWGVSHLTAYEALWLRRIGELEGPFDDEEQAEAAALARNRSPAMPARRPIGVDTLLGISS